MVELPERALVIGLDAPIAPRLYEFAKSGQLPTFRKLIEGGVYAKHCLVPLPTITPPNWTTIVTGAWPGTHGITCFNMHKPGMPLTETYPAFDSRDCQAEYIWQAAERAGKRAIIINWPSTWPPTTDSLIQVGGAGLSVNEWRVDIPRGEAFRIALSDSLCFSTEEYPLATVVEVDEAKGWRNVDLGGRCLEAELRLRCRRPRFKVEEKVWYALIRSSSGGELDTVLLAREKDGRTAFAELRVGEWSDVVVDTFVVDSEPMRAAFRVKLLELSGDGSRLKLFVTPISSVDARGLPAHPASVAEELPLSSDVFPIAAHGVYEAYNLGWIDLSTWLECVDMEHEWLSRAAAHLLRTKKWDLFFMHMHCPDWAYHMFSSEIDELTAKDKSKVKLYQEAELKFYQSIDRAVARILEAAGEKALTVVTSDHGAKPTTKGFSVAEVLEKAGLLCLREDPETGRKVVDLSRSKAIPQRSVYIYVNLKGRDPHGIVDPEDYERVREEVIKALYEYTDPETGKKPILFAIKREDARILGLHGDRIGDVVFAMNPEFGGQHGPYLPTARYGIGDLRGLLILHGPGVKKGYVMERTCWLTDIVPTLCYLLRIPVPRHAEGAILYQALEDPDYLVKELERLRRNYELLREAFEKERQLTHTYHEV